MQPVASVPPTNPGVSMPDRIAPLATLSIHKDEGVMHNVMQAQRYGSKAFRVKNEGQLGFQERGMRSVTVGEVHTGRAVGAEGR